MVEVKAPGPASTDPAAASLRDCPISPPHAARGAWQAIRCRGALRCVTCCGLCWHPRPRVRSLEDGEQSRGVNGEVTGGCRYAGVAEQFLDAAQIATASHEMRGEGMSTMSLET
jgi:hypothetical protein